MADVVEQVVEGQEDSPPGRKRSTKRTAAPEAAAAQDLADITTIASETAPTTPETPAPETPPPAATPETPAQPGDQPAAPETPAAAAEAPQDPLLQRLSGLGFENLTDRTEAEQRLLDAYEQQQRELDEQLAWRRQNEPLVGYGRQAIATPQQQAAAEAPKPKPWEAPVAYPEHAKRYLTQDEKGEAAWKPDTPAEVRAQTERYIAWRDQIVSTIAERPEQFFQMLGQMFDERAKQVIEPFYEQRTREQQESAVLDDYVAKNAAKIYRVDPVTKQPRVGEFSDRGALLNERFLLHKQNQYLTIQQALEYAEYDVERATRGNSAATAAAGVPATPPAAVSTHAQSAEQRRREAVDRGNQRAAQRRAANGTPRNRVGSIPLPGENRRQNDNGGFGEDFVEELMRQPSTTTI